MTIEVVGNRVFAAGPVGGDDYLGFREALRAPGVDTVVFVNSSGGDLWTGIHVSMMLADRELTTVVVGQCFSACALMFLGGKQRAFANALSPLRTLVGIHGAHQRDTKRIDPRLQSDIYAVLRARLGERFDADLMNHALNRMEDAGALLRLRDPARNRGRDAVAHFCPRGDSPRSDCIDYPGKDAFTLGVVTQREPVAVEVPGKFLPPLAFFGRALEAPDPDVPARLERVMETVCRDEACRARIAGWPSLAEDRALAVGLARPGYGYSFGVGDPHAAVERALFACNHAERNPKLCRAYLVNGFPLFPLYDESAAQSAHALAALTVPTEPEIGDELRTWPFVGRAEIRARELGSPTPLEAPGVKRITTRELAALLTAAGARPVVVDVTGTGGMLPGSLHFVRAGLAAADPNRDGEFDRRFRDMLARAVPGPAHPVVFYCTGPRSWLSLNAALRATRAGYTNVLWYRGGLESWQSARLPVVQKVPVAVIALAAP